MNESKYNWDVARENMRNIRLNAGLTQLQLSIELGWSSSSIANIENGKNAPSILYVIAFCDYFKVGLEDLYRENSENNKNGGK